MPDIQTVMCYQVVTTKFARLSPNILQKFLPQKLAGCQRTCCKAGTTQFYKFISCKGHYHKIFHIGTIHVVRLLPNSLPDYFHVHAEYCVQFYCRQAGSTELDAQVARLLTIMLQVVAA